jgi:hypothetical protein
MSRGSVSPIAVLAVLVVSACFEEVDVGPNGVANTDTTTAGDETAGDETAGDDTAGDDTAGDDTGSDDAAAACSDYCTLIRDHCEGDLVQYSGTLDCERSCLAMQLGDPGAMTGNTVGCRTTHAILAARDPIVHCPHAGPSGGDLCGGACESFCSLAVKLCIDEHQVWSNVEECAGDCVQFPTDPPYAATVQSGDSYACRLAHLTLAALQPEVHCEHVAPVSVTCN